MRRRRGRNDKSGPASDSEDARHAAFCLDMQKKFESIQQETHQSLRTVFEDFCTMTANTMHNMVPVVKNHFSPNLPLNESAVLGLYDGAYKDCEKQYMEVVKKYEGSNAFDRFSSILTDLSVAMKNSPFDYLGHIYCNMNLNSQKTGQIFTPWQICAFMAQASLPSKANFERCVEKNGYFSFYDPCCGSGRMAVEMAKLLRFEYGVENLSGKLYVKMVDIDRTCAHMAYCNMVLLGLSSRVVWGDSLTGKENFVYDTPMLQLAARNGKERQEGEEIDKS